MDSKELADYVSSKFLTKLKWKFHEFRKVHQKPELTLTNIIVKKDTINCIATLTVGGKVKYKDQTMNFMLKDGKIQSVSEPIKAKAVKRIINARDFWSAAKQAETFAVVKIERYKSATFEKLLPLPKDYANEQVKLSRWLQYYIPKSGQYLVPVI